jgi:hypothetical protein
MSNFSFTTPDWIHWTAIDKWEFFRYVKNGMDTVDDIMYQKEFDRTYPGFKIDPGLQK